MLKQTLVATVALALAATPAFAFGFTHNWAVVNTTVSSSANTGSNSVTASDHAGAFNNQVGGGSATNQTFVLTATNTNLGEVHSVHNAAVVNTTVSSSANTGSNSVTAYNHAGASGNTVVGGDATNSTGVVTVTNSNVNFE